MSNLLFLNILPKCLFFRIKALTHKNSKNSLMRKTFIKLLQKRNNHKLEKKLIKLWNIIIIIFIQKLLDKINIQLKN